MASSANRDVIGTLKRLLYVSVGIWLIGLGVLRQTIDGEPISGWRRALVIAGGSFFIYVGMMYYFPKYRRRRKELDALLDEAEREMKEHRKPR